MGESRVHSANAANNQIFKPPYPAEQLMDKNIADKEAALLKSQEITGDGSAVKRIFAEQESKAVADTYQPNAEGKLVPTGGTFKSTATDVVDSPTPSKSIFKSKKSKAQDLTDRMDAMNPDHPEFMKLSAQLDKIKL